MKTAEAADAEPEAKAVEREAMDPEAGEPEAVDAEPGAEAVEPDTVADRVALDVEIPEHHVAVTARTRPIREHHMAYLG